MTQGEKRFLFLSLFGAFLTGSLIFLLKTFFQVEGEFGYEEHSWMSNVKILHYLAVPFLILSFGVLWKGHIRKGLVQKNRKKKKSGWMIIILMTVLVFSGQSLLFLVNAGARYYIGWAHFLVGASLFMGIFFHSKRKA